jgi:RNA polymerase sigma-70 factor (ECF subfamily)
MQYGEPEFQRIYADFQPRILRYMGRMVGEREAEDLTQEVFVKVNRALAGFRGESSLST